MFVIKFVNKNVKKFSNYQQIRYIPKWSSRSPKGIFFPGVEDKLNANRNKIYPDYEETETSSVPINFSFHHKNAKSESKLPTLRKMKKEVSTDMLETVINAEGNVIYTKMDNNDSRISAVLANLKSSNNIKKQQSFLVEGTRLIQEALRAGCKLQYILFSKRTDLEEIKEDLPKFGAQIYKMPYKEMQYWSDLNTTPGFMGVFKIPEVKETKHSLPVNVICDNIREPGNLGSILRTCAAVGCKAVILTKGCCDVWNTKVLRGGMGAHFKIHIKKQTWEQIGQQINTSWFIADNNLVKTSRNYIMMGDLINQIPMEPYDVLKYSSTQEISLIIGGETEGVSQEAYSLVQSKGGLRVNIPLNNNVESINSATALAVLLFEMRRQINK